MPSADSTLIQDIGGSKLTSPSCPTTNQNHGLITSPGIRSPAANNGVFGLRPTALRIPVRGMAHAMGGCEQLLGTLGLLSTSICGIKLFMKTVIDSEPWLIEPSLVPIPWQHRQAQDQDSDHVG